MLVLKPCNKRLKPSIPPFAFATKKVGGHCQCGCRPFSSCKHTRPRTTICSEAKPHYSSANYTVTPLCPARYFPSHHRIPGQCSTKTLSKNPHRPGTPISSVPHVWRNAASLRSAKRCGLSYAPAHHRYLETKHRHLVV